MIIVEQGKIVEVCAEPGEYIYNTSTEPSIFQEVLVHQLKKYLKQFVRDLLMVEIQVKIKEYIILILRNLLTISLEHLI